MNCLSDCMNAFVVENCKRLDSLFDCYKEEKCKAKRENDKSTSKDKIKRIIYSMMMRKTEICGIVE